MRRIRIKGGMDIVIDGIVNGQEVPIVLDSGTAISVVPEGMVSDELLTGDAVFVMAFQSKEPVSMPTARVQFKVEHLVWEEEVALAPTVEGQEAEILCKLDVKSDRGFTLASLVREREKVLRAEAQKQAEEDKLNAEAVAKENELEEEVEEEVSITAEETDDELVFLDAKEELVVLQEEDEMLVGQNVPVLGHNSEKKIAREAREQLFLLERPVEASEDSVRDWCVLIKAEQSMEEMLSELEAVAVEEGWCDRKASQSPAHAGSVADRGKKPSEVRERLFLLEHPAEEWQDWVEKLDRLTVESQVDLDGVEEELVEVEDFKYPKDKPVLTEEGEVVEVEFLHWREQEFVVDCLGAREDCLGAREEEIVLDCLGAREDCLGAREEEDEVEGMAEEEVEPLDRKEEEFGDERGVPVIRAEDNDLGLSASREEVVVVRPRQKAVELKLSCRRGDPRFRERIKVLCDRETTGSYAVVVVETKQESYVDGRNLDEEVIIEFVQGLARRSSVLSPWNARLSPSVVEWTKEGLEAFRNIKVCFISLCVLTVPLEEDVFVLHWDASGAEYRPGEEHLSQEGDPWRPAAVLQREEADELRAAPSSQLVGGDVGTSPTEKWSKQELCKGSSG